MAKSARPFLMFQNGDAEEAMSFYVSVFTPAEVIRVTRFGAEMPAAEGKVMQAEFTICGQHVFCSDSPIKHAFDFTPSISMFIDCTSADELDSAVSRLLEAGETLMPVGNYGFSQRFAWIKDRFGVSWQLNLA
jgi:predicted 3-demethylubiquinone-9 3-methyltransferase (glyoxalase superfamily)